ncbi:MAG TPA: HU family DNA-binding protein [Bacteroides reticulotermitis]|nr:HU family DNA-binding protein [Bacteroides reticulotermitis]
MAQMYVVVQRKNPFKPQETPKFYATARSTRKVDTDEVIKRISERSSYSIGELKGCITEFLLEIKNQLELGNIVILGDLGRFRVTVSTGLATETAKEFKPITCIKKAHVRFLPGEMLLDMCKALKYTLYKPDKDGDEEEPTDPGDGGGEAPDPTV